MSELDKIKKKLADHEKRLLKLEGTSSSSPKEREKTRKKSLTDMFVNLKNEKFFDKPRSVDEIIIKLAQNGHHYPPSSLTSPLQRATRKKILGRMKKDDIWVYVKR